MYTILYCNSLGVVSLKRKREERRFVDSNIVLMLHCCNGFLKQVLNICFKLDDFVPRNGSTIKSFFLRAVFPEHKVCLNRILWIAL